jgi:hypothetical protein
MVQEDMGIVNEFHIFLDFQGVGSSVDDMGMYWSRLCSPSRMGAITLLRYCE